jgi:N-formylmaleamate deformylase
VQPPISEQRIQPVGASHRVRANGVSLHYLEYGRGEPTILVVPGITSPAITWEFVAVELAREARVLVLDVRGRGLSDKPKGGYALEDYAGDVRDLVRAVAPEHTVLLGHSMGARIVAAAAALHPRLASSVIVVDPPLSGPGRAPYPFPIEVYVNALAEARAGATADAMARYYPTWPRRELEIRAQWLSTCDERAVVETYRNFHEEDFFDFWPRVPAPVLFVYGERSPVVPQEALAEVKLKNPDAEFVGIPQAGHMIPFENLSGFLAVVLEFVTRTARGQL